MDSHKQFEILIRQKIPYVSSLLFGIAFCFSAVLFILYLIMLPTRYASGEMTAAYYILVVPDWLKTISTYSGLGLLVLIPIYYKARLHKPAVLEFHHEHLTARGKQINLSIPYRKIRKIFFNDVHNLLRKPKGILQLVIQQKGHKEMTFRLKHYEQGEQVVEELSKLENIQFAFYEDNMINNHDDE